MGKVMLEVRNLKTKYVTRFHEDVYAVDGVSFKIEEGKSLGIAGESGCGKSTLALSMMGYYFPPLHYMSGDIVIDGRNISGMKPDDVRKSILGTEIAYIPQAAMNALNPTQRIIRFIEDVVRAHDPKKDKTLIRELAEARFAELGLPPEVLDKHAVELSGGMKQRLGIAIALAGDPDFLVLDEPVNGLDPQGIVEMRELILKLNRERQITVLISSHILDELSRLATGIIDNGRMVKELSAEELDAACRKCVRMEVSDTAALARVLDAMNLEYKIISATTADVFAKVNVTQLAVALAKENCEVLSMQEKDESLESYYISLVGGGSNA